jgi:hypothetical protein
MAIAATASAMQRERMAEQKAAVKPSPRARRAPTTCSKRHLAEAATAAGKLIAGPFGAKATHQQPGSPKPARRAALAGPKAHQPAASALGAGRAAMAETPAQRHPHPAARAHATPLEGMTAPEKYALWLDYDALVTAATAATWKCSQKPGNAASMWASRRAPFTAPGRAGQGAKRNPRRVGTATGHPGEAGPSTTERCEYDGKRVHGQDGGRHVPHGWRRPDRPAGQHRHHGAGAPAAQRPAARPTPA